MIPQPSRQGSVCPRCRTGLTANEAAGGCPRCLASGMSNWTIPNILSGLRIASVPLLIALAWRGESRLYLICFALASLTDLLDGFLARLLNRRTELGANLDLWGDAGVLLSLPLAFWWMWPDVLRSECWFIGTALASYAISAVVALWKFRQLASYHTWLGKTATWMLSIGAAIAMLGWTNWLLRVGLALMIAAIIEEISITFILSAPRSDLQSWWHARRLNQSARRTPNNDREPGRVTIQL